MAASSIVLTSSASGRVLIDQLTAMPSKQSIMGERYTLPAGIWNSVMSVSHFSLGALALKSRFKRLSGAGLISPMYESYRRRLGTMGTRLCCFIRRRTTFPEMFTEAFASEACILR